ncbi:hypothetical protein [Flavobacterium restrictum]|uniref:Lipoprotein n=1 Tax=Flavobacterium restrictum TaxID=2594428 RepID=A0A553DXR6_9FLAO|nr:hypothetical protein [Flavobacterium restrictum]TRX37588.1 hypothetical protein FNW21_12450 [Flavobacterium restrictum]
MKKYLLILAAFVFISCKKHRAEPFGLNFYFENPQPINDAELCKIPNKFQGLYKSPDNVFININENSILFENYYTFRLHKNTLDSLKQEFDFSNGKYISKINHSIYVIKIIGDSVELSNKDVDTFFVFSNTQKAKRFNGQLVLNFKDSIYWKVKSICLEKNILKIKYIYSDEDLKKMDSLTKIKSTRIDSSSFIIRPSRNEFKQILNLKNLVEDSEYKKQTK